MGPPGDFIGEGGGISAGENGAVVSVADEVFGADAVAYYTGEAAVKGLRDDEAEAFLKGRADEDGGVAEGSREVGLAYGAVEGEGG